MRSHRFALRPWLALTLAAALAPAAPADDWPQWLGPRRDGVWREEGVLDRFPPGGPKVRWRVPIGSGYAGPAVAGKCVFVSDYVTRPGGKLPESGFSPRGQRYRLPGAERVLCLDDASGQVLWEREYETVYDGLDYPAGPRATPLVAGGKVYALGAMGDLRCLDAATGKPLWAKNFPKDFAAPVQTWGFAAHPLLDGDRLICLVGGDGSGVVAFHKDTGKELWRNLSATALGYAPPMIYTVGRARQLIVWTAEAVSALVPETGKLLWEEPFNVKASLSVPTPLFDGERLLVTSFYNGALMLKLDADKPGATVLWKSMGRGEKPNLTDTLHSIIPTPVLKDGSIYGVCSYGELRCLKADSGERVWKTMAATRPLKAGKPDESPETEKDRWGNAFLVPHGDRYFLFNEHGELIIAKLSPQGYEEIDRARILQADNRMPGRPVVWSHPAFAHKSAYARNDHEIVCVSLEK